MTQNICITFVQCWTNVFDVGPTLYKCYTNVLCVLVKTGVIEVDQASLGEMGCSTWDTFNQ